MAVVWVRVMPAVTDVARALCWFVATGAGEDHPEVGLVEVFGDAASAVVDCAQFGLGGDVALLGGAGKPADGFDFVAGDFTLFVAVA